MGIYMFTLFGAVFLAYCAEKFPFSKCDLVRHQPDRVWVFLLIVFLIIVSGFRYQNYYLSDEYNYRYMVTSQIGIPFDWSLLTASSEWLFSVLIWICANVFGSDQALILISAAITNTLIVLFFARNSNPFWFSIFLYIAGGAFTSSMNVLRQYIAISIILWCYHLAEKGKLLSYVSLVFLASFFHQSALIMLPFYFILQRKQFDLWTVVILFFSAFIFVNFESVMSLLLPNTQYDHYLEDIMSNRYGVMWLRVLAWLIPYCIILIYHRYFYLCGGVSYLYIYTVLISACISVISTQYVYAARIDPYFSLATYVAIIHIPERFARKSRPLILSAILILFFLFGLYQHLINPKYHNILFESISGVL